MALHRIVSASMSSSGDKLIAAARGGDVAAMSAIAAEEAADIAAVVNYRNSVGNTALMRAAWNNRPAALRWLIDRGADLNATDKWGSTAAMEAAIGGYVEALRLLADAGADLAIRDNNGDTALTYAQQNKKADCVAIIEQRQAMPMR